MYMTCKLCVLWLLKLDIESWIWNLESRILNFVISNLELAIWIFVSLDKCQNIEMKNYERNKITQTSSYEYILFKLQPINNYLYCPCWSYWLFLLVIGIHIFIFMAFSSAETNTNSNSKSISSYFLAILQNMKYIV